MFDHFDNIGKIVKIRNIIFNDDKSKKNSVDHSFNTGRPCVIIDEIDGKMYLLPCSSSKKKNDIKIVIF